MKYEFESEIHYEIYREETLIDSKPTLKEAIECARKHSNLNSFEYTVKSVKIETNTEFVLQLGKIKD